MKTEEQLIGSLIANTSTKKRVKSILEIAADLKELLRIRGNIKEVSKVIGISSNMLNKFLSVFKLSKNLQDLVKERKIDSVEIIYSLAKFPEDVQLIIAKNVIAGKLSSQDVRALSPFIKQNFGQDTEVLIESLLKSKNIKVSVLHFDILNKTSKEKIDNKLKEIIGIENIFLLEYQDNIGTLKISREGERRIRNEAKKKFLSLRQYLQWLINN